MIKIINRKKNRSNESLSRSKKKTSGRWLYRLVMFFFLLTVGFALFFSGFLTIVEIKITGLEKLDEAPIRKIIEEKINGKYFNLVPKDSLVLFPENSLKKELQEKFRRIEDVRVERKFPDRIIVSIKERKLTMMLCSSGRCYLLNERGEAYPADNFSFEELEKENLITLNDLSGAQISTENNPLESDFQAFILQLGEQVQKETELLIKRQYETPSRMSNDLKVETEAGWKIYFSEEVGLEKELLMLKTVLAEKIEKERQKDLEYIDLRIANKVFYKFKEGTELIQETESAPAPAPEVKKKDNGKKKK